MASIVVRDIRSTGGNGGAETRLWRPEIQGIRVLAATSVLVSHLFLPDRVLGGVDMFFVLSGYLIAPQLIRQVEREGRVRPLRFLAQRLVRLAPAAGVVLLAVMAVTWLVLPRSGAGATLAHVIPSALFIENWHLAFTGREYLALGPTENPVGHYWAFSAIAQLFVLAMLLVIVASFVAKRLGWKVQSVVVGVFAALSVASFVYSVIHTAANPQFAYFNTFARAWEFGLGALTALIVITMRRRVRSLVHIVGLLLAVFGASLAPASLQYPGFVALIPCLAVVMILVDGTSEPRSNVTRLLSTKALSFLGGLAYSVYLWHWPLYIWFLTLRGQDLVGWRGAFAIIVATLVLAYLTNRLVEKPALAWAASKRSMPRRAVVVVTSAAIILIVSLAAIGQGILGRQEQVDRVLVADVVGPLVRTAPDSGERGTLPEPRCFGAGALLIDPDGVCTDPDLGDLLFPTGDVKRSRPFEGVDGCHVDVDAEDGWAECIYGSVGADKRILLAGGSHSSHWLPAFEILAEQENWEVWVFIRNGCPVTAAPMAPACEDWNRAFQQRISELPPFDAMVATYWTDRVWFDAEGQPSAEVGVQGFLDAWMPLLDRGTQVIAIRDNPFVTHALLRCVEREGLAATTLCTAPRDQVLLPDLAVEAAQRVEGAHAIDLSDLYCSATTCAGVYGHTKVYTDRHHVTVPYTVSMAPYLREALKSVPGILEGDA